MAFFNLLLLGLFLQGNAAENLHGAQNNQNDLLAFSAELTSDKEYSAGATIVCDRVHSNVGGLYANTSGQFFCPDGLYVFIWNLLKANVAELPGMRCIASLSSVGAELKYGPKTNYINTDFSSVPEMTAIHKCSNNTPAAVTITAQPWTEEISSASIFYRLYTTFSGFRLHTGVAFTAELSQEQLAFPGARIMFDKVLANYGDHYELTNGLFRCPDDGIYVFSVSAYTEDPSTPWSVSRLMMERKVILQGPITYKATDDYDSGSASTTAVFQCTPGFSVYVEAQATHNFTHNSYGSKLTSFTGFKLYDATSESVAFTVVMTQNVTINASGQPVLFDDVVTNIGNAFDTTNSRFVCPDAAYYLFTWSIASAVGVASIDLHMDGSLVKYLYARSPIDATDPGTSGSSTMSVILQCQPYSLFHLVGRTAGDKILGGYVSFSGYKLPG